MINCYISDCKADGQDAQAVAGWNGPGPFKIVNNYLEASGENFMLGGSLAAITGLIPADVEFRNNHLFKPLSWRSAIPTTRARLGASKLFELKNAQRSVEGNILENNWAPCQSGWRSSSRRAPRVAMGNQVSDITWSTTSSSTAKAGSTGPAR